MNEYPDLSLFLQNLWLRENAIGLKAIEGKGGYNNGKYYPYKTANGNIDVGPGFDMDKQTPEFRKRAAEGFTKEELDNMVLNIARNELPYFRKRIVREGGNPDKVTGAIYNGLLDMYWQLKNGLYGYDNFWRAVANLDYEGMRNESATYYLPENGKIPKGAIVKDGKILDTGRWDFRKTNYFKDPETLNNTVNDVVVQTSPIMEPAFDGSMYVERPNVIRNYKPVVFPSDTRMDVRKGMQNKIDFNNFMDSIRIQNNLQTYNFPIQFNNGEATKNNQYDKGGSLKFPQWDNLSIKEKADIMKVAINNGITNLNDIKQQYNEFAEGGNLFDIGGLTEGEPIKSIDLGNYNLDDLNEQQLRNLSTELFFQGDLKNSKTVAKRVNAYSVPRVARMNKIANASQPLNLPEVIITPDTSDKVAYTEAMNQPYYQVHEQPSFEEWKNQRDLFNRAQGELMATPSINPLVDPIVKGIQNYTEEFKYDLANNKVPSGKYLIPAAIATAAGASYIPTATSKLATMLAPGSSFWMNPLTQQMVTSTVAAEGVNAGTRLLTEYDPEKGTGYSSVGDAVGSTVENLTGWNPNDTWFGPLVTESFNPGWYASPTGMLSVIGNTGNKIETTLGNTFSKANRAKVKRLIFGNAHQPNIIQRALGKPNEHDFSTFNKLIEDLGQKGGDYDDRAWFLARIKSDISCLPSDSNKKNIAFLRAKPFDKNTHPQLKQSTSTIVEPGKFEVKESPIEIIGADGNVIKGTTQNLVYKPAQFESKEIEIPFDYGTDRTVYSTGMYDLLSPFQETRTFPNVRKIVQGPDIDYRNANVVKDNLTFPLRNNPEFTQELQNYIRQLESEYGYPVVGSTRGMANEYFGGLPGDTEIIVPKGQVQDAYSKLGFNFNRRTKGDTGVTGYSSKAFIGKDGKENLDINILGDKGTIIHQLESTRNPDKMPVLYDDLAKQQANAGITSDGITKSADLNIPKETGTGNYTAQEYFDIIKNNKELLDQSVVDNLFKSHNAKHVTRAYAMMNNSNPDAVKKVSTAIDHMIAQIPKMKRFSKLYPSQNFDNIEKNKEILEKIGFVPIEIDKFASNPEQMKNIVDYWYMRNTVGTRSVNYETGPGKTNSFEEMMQAMRQFGYGSSAGGGGNEILGNTFGGFTRDYVAYNYHDPMLDKRTATFDDVFNYFEREKNIWNTDEAANVIQQVFKEHNLPSPSNLNHRFTDDVYRLVGRGELSSQEGDTMIKEISEKLGVTGFRGEPYGSHNFSDYGNYYGAMQRPGLSGENSEPLSAHRNIDNRNEHNMPIMPAEWGSNDMFIKDIIQQVDNAPRTIVNETYEISPDFPALTFEEAAKQYPKDFIDLEPYVVRKEVFDFPNKPVSSSGFSVPGSNYFKQPKEKLKKKTVIDKQETISNIDKEIKDLYDKRDEARLSQQLVENKKSELGRKYRNASSKYLDKIEKLQKYGTIMAAIGTPIAGGSYIMHKENEKTEKAIATLEQYVKDGTIKEVKDSDGSVLYYKIPKTNENRKLVRKNSYFKQLQRHGLLEWESLASPVEQFKESEKELHEWLEEPQQTPKVNALGGNLYAPGGPVKTLNPSVLRAMKYFMDRGFTDYQAAGFVGNLMRESSMDPNALNKWSNAFGLAQWLGDRRKALFAMYGPKPTFEQQLDFIWHELNTTHKNGLNYILASKDAEEAARNTMGYYEFSAGPEGAIAAMNKHKQNGQASMDKGIEFAKQFYGYYNPMSLEQQKPQDPVLVAKPMFNVNPIDNTYVERPKYYDISMSTPVKEQYSPEVLAREQARDNLNTLATVLGILDTHSKSPINILKYLAI